MGAYLELSNFFKNGLINEAKKFKYSNSNILILEGQESSLKTEYPAIYSNLVSCKHNRDRRMIMEYAQDLVASWVFEDYLIEEFKKIGYILEKSGTDKNREILSSSKVSAASDCLLKHNGNSILIEIMSDYKGYWTKYNKVDLRDDKFNKLKISKSKFLGISVKDKLYFLLNFNNDINATYSPSHFAYGGKPVYSITLRKDILKPFDIENIAKDIIQF